MYGGDPERRASMRYRGEVSLQRFWSQRVEARRANHQDTPDMTIVAPSCDVLILVAIKAELEALRSVCTDLGVAFERKQWDPLGEYFDLGTVGADRVFAARTKMGAIRHEGSAYKAILFQRAAQATSIIQIGMAFGVDPKHQHHGDVLVARSMFPYDDRTIRMAGGHPIVDYSQTKRRAAKNSLVKLFEREIERGGHTFDTHVGMLLSGGARIFSAKFRDDLVGSIPPGRDRIVGGEMEGVGLLSVSPADKPLWAVVKGISDFADEDRDVIIETTRQLACVNAVRFVLSALRNNLS
jgi:adenosylhomocysteine nucleosidase